MEKVNTAKPSLSLFQGLAKVASPCQHAWMTPMLLGCVGNGSLTPDVTRFPERETKTANEDDGTWQQRGNSGQTADEHALTRFRGLLSDRGRHLSGEGDGRGLRQMCGFLHARPEGLSWETSSYPPSQDVFSRTRPSSSLFRCQVHGLRELKKRTNTEFP